MRFLTKFIFCAVAVFLIPGQSFARVIVINAVGDIMLAGSVTSTLKKQGYDYPFAATAAELHKGDISMGNLESPITQGGKEFTGKKYRFRCAPQSAPALRNAGFSVVTLANNHMMDFIKGVELLPLNVQNREVHFQPQVLSGKKGQKVIDHLTRISRRWNTFVSATDGRFMVRFHRDGTLAWK